MTKLTLYFTYLLVIFSCLSLTLRAQVKNPVVPSSTGYGYTHGKYPSWGNRTHPGVDILAGKDKPIFAFADGEVVSVQNNQIEDCKKNSGLGNFVIIKHFPMANGKIFYTIYLHLQPNLNVKAKDKVIGGKTQIGLVGRTGAANCSYHTHFEIRYFPTKLLEDKKWNDPYNIYGNGDFRNEDIFLNNWEDPLPLFAKYPSGMNINTVSSTEIVELPTMFLLDVSGSMEDGDKITQAKTAGLDAVREMQENRRRKQDNSTVSIWTFGGECSPRDVKQLLAFTSNLNQAENIFQRGIARPAGATPLFTAINLSVNRMSDYLAARSQIIEGRIVVLTDGVNTCDDQIRPRGVYSQSQTIVYQKIKFYCIGFDIEPGSQAERDLQYLASASGGKYFPARDSQQLRRVFQKVVRVYQPKVSNNESGTQAIVKRDFGNALQIWTIYVKNNPNDPIGYYNLALVCEAVERPKCAKENYQQYLKLLANAPDATEIGTRITTLEEDYRIGFEYYIDLLRSDLEYLKAYYKRLSSLKNDELAAEFAGFVAEKGAFYRNLPTILEIRGGRIERNTTELADSLDFLNRRANSPSFDRDALSLLTIPIGHLEELVERLDEYKTKNF